MVFTGFHVDRDPRQDFRAHRCEGSLKAHASIRMEPDRSWKLRQLELDSEWCVWYMREVATIRYCPWCGKRLWPMMLRDEVGANAD